MTKDEALKLALEFIENSECGTADLEARIKEALAQPEQEPVLWMMPDGKTVDKWGLQFYSSDVGTPLYTTPPQRKPLTDEEILSIARDHYNPHQRPEISFARAIEAKLKEKNT